MGDYLARSSETATKLSKLGLPASKMSPFTRAKHVRLGPETHAGPARATSDIASRHQPNCNRRAAYGSTAVLGVGCTCPNRRPILIPPGESGAFATGSLAIKRFGAWIHAVFVHSARRLNHMVDAARNPDRDATERTGRTQVCRSSRKGTLDG